MTLTSSYTVSLIMRPLYMQDQLRAQKQLSQGRAVYCLGIRYDAPGMFFLGHVLRERL